MNWTTHVLVGFGVAASTGRYLSGLLFGVTPTDPATFVVVGVALAAIRSRRLRAFRPGAPRKLTQSMR